MPESVTHENGAYRYLPGTATFSNGIRALQGYRIIEWELAELEPLEIGFERIDRELDARDLTWDALAGVDIRSPEPLDTERFSAFNSAYTELIRKYLPHDADAPLRITRTNAAPISPITNQPALRAVQVVEPAAGAAGGDFVLSGLAEIRGKLTPEATIAYRDTSPVALRSKVDFVATELATRLAALGATPDEARIVDVYCAHPLQWVETRLADTFGSIRHYGLHRWLARPPVIDLEFEMGCKSISTRQIIL